jgi:hypothetical protein
MASRLINSLLLLIMSGFQSSLTATELEGYVKHQDIYQQELTDKDHHSLLSRFLIRHNWQTSENTTLLLEGVSAYDSSYDNQTFSAEHNSADIHQIIFKTNIADTSIRLGRQVWSVGNQRQLGKREGTNVRRRFDGILLDHPLTPDTTVSLYHGYSVRSTAEVLDDRADPDLTASGVILRQQQLMVHAIHYLDNRGINKDDIYAIETEYQHNTAAVAAFYQLIYQYGDQSSQQLSAWFGQLEWAYTIGQHRLNFTGSYASGGGSQAGASHDFQPLFAKVPYYSEAGVFATTNIYHLGIGWMYSATENFSLGLDAKKLYKVDRNGAIYGPGQMILLPANQSTGQFLANAYNFKSEFKLSPELSFELVASFIGTLARENKIGTSRNSIFLETILHYRF